MTRPPRERATKTHQCSNRNTSTKCSDWNISAICSGWNIMTICSDWNIRQYVPTGTFNHFFLARHLNNPPECSDWNIGRVLHTIQLARGNSTLHSKCESHYSANSSGSSTIYGTRHRCCQSEGRRG